MTPGCYICDPDSFESDEEPCMACFNEWLDYLELQDNWPWGLGLH